MFLDLSIKSSGRYHLFAVFDGIRHRAGRSCAHMKAAGKEARRLIDRGAAEVEIVNTRTRKVFRIA